LLSVGLSSSPAGEPIGTARTQKAQLFAPVMSRFYLKNTPFRLLRGTASFFIVTVGCEAR